MRRLAAATLAAVLVWPVAAPGQQPAEVEAATRTVMSQLEALRRDDFDTAYSFASTTIKAQFDRTAFQRMVTGGYPEIAHSATAHVDHGEVGADGRVYLFVKIYGTNRQEVDALYELVIEDGQWRIDGVITRPVNGMI